MKPKEYILETSSDGIKWHMAARFSEGDMSRFGQPFSPEVMLLEARSFIEYWRSEKWLHDNLGDKRGILSRRELNERQRVRVIIEI